MFSRDWDVPSRIKVESSANCVSLYSSHTPTVGSWLYIFAHPEKHLKHTHIWRDVH